MGLNKQQIWIGVLIAAALILAYLLATHFDSSVTGFSILNPNNTENTTTNNSPNNGITNQDADGVSTTTIPQEVLDGSSSLMDIDDGLPPVTGSPALNNRQAGNIGFKLTYESAVKYNLLKKQA